MKRLALVLLAVLITAVLTVPAQADCGRVCHVRKVVVAEAVVTPVVVAQFVPIFVPLYSVSIAAPVVPVTPAASAAAPSVATTAAAQLDQVKALQDELARLRKELDEYRRLSKPAVQTSEPKTMPKEESSLPSDGRGKSVSPERWAESIRETAEGKRGTSPLVGAATKCFACHSEAASVKEGGGFVMFQGNALKAPGDFPPGKQVKVLTKTYLSQMPPKGNKQGVPALTDDEVSALQSYFAGK